MREHGGVEFFDAEPGHGPDEDLVQPVGFPRLRRARLPLLVAGGIGILAIIAVSVANEPQGTPAAGPATVTVAPSSTSRAPIPTPTVTPNGRLAVRLPSLRCPARSSCAVLSTTPHAVSAAVRHALSRAGHVHTTTTTEHADVPGSRLLARRITALAGTARLSIVIGAAKPADQLGWNASETAGRTLATVDDHVDGHLVSLRLTAPPGYRVDIAAVRHLAADHRLLAPS